MSLNRVWIQLYKDVFICGEPIQGQINVNCNQPNKFDGVFLKIKAYEETAWVSLQHIPVNPQVPLNVPEDKIQRVDDIDVSDDTSDSDVELPQKKEYEYIRKANQQVYRVSRGKGKVAIIGQTVDLGPLNAGQYSIPFQFNSSREWPGTFHQQYYNYYPYIYL